LPRPRAGTEPCRLRNLRRARRSSLSLPGHVGFWRWLWSTSRGDPIPDGRMPSGGYPAGSAGSRRAIPPSHSRTACSTSGGLPGWPALDVRAIAGAPTPKGASHCLPLTPAPGATHAVISLSPPTVVTWDCRWPPSVLVRPWTPSMEVVARSVMVPRSGDRGRRVHGFSPRRRMASRRSLVPSSAPSSPSG